MTWCFKHYNETILKFEAGDIRKRLVSIFMNFRFPESRFRKLLYILIPRKEASQK